MNLFEEAKKRYHEIPIPDELTERVQLEIRLAKEKQEKENQHSNYLQLKHFTLL